MTTPHTNNSLHHQENGRSQATGGNGVVVPDLMPLAHRDLDSLCRSVMNLARDAPRPPLRIKLQHGHMTVELEWPETASGRSRPGAEPGAEQVNGAVGPGTSGTECPGPPQAQEDGTLYLLAPTVGTFYHAPEPGAPPFVAVGDVIRPGQPVGILEVMKMMTPVEAVAAGRVKEFLIPDAHPVEFEQRIIALEPLAAGEA